MFFRAESVPQAWSILTAIVLDPTFSNFAVGAISSVLFFAGPLIVYEIWLEQTGDHERLLNERWWGRGLVYAYCIFMVLFFPPLSAQSFIYFQF